MRPEQQSARRGQKVTRLESDGDEPFDRRVCNDFCHRQTRPSGLVGEAQARHDAREPATPSEVRAVGSEARADLARREDAGPLASSREFQRPR